jgi:hypothetical protein
MQLLIEQMQQLFKAQLLIVFKTQLLTSCGRSPPVSRWPC